MTKLALTLIATLLPLMHQNAIARAAKWVSAATATQLVAKDCVPLKTELVQKSALAIVLLLAITALGMYKPWGLTSYGRRKEQHDLVPDDRVDHVTPLGVKVFYAAAGLLVLVMLVLHLTGHSLGHHH